MSNVKRILRSLLENSRSSIAMKHPIQEEYSVVDWEAKGWKYNSTESGEIFTKEFGNSRMVVGIEHDTVYITIYPDKNEGTFYRRFISKKNYNVDYAENILSKIRNRIDDVDYLDSLGFVEGEL